MSTFTPFGMFTQLLGEHITINVNVKNFFHRNVKKFILPESSCISQEMGVTSRAMIDIPTYLKEIRKRFGLTQAEFAGLLGDKRSNIAKYETDQANLSLRKFLSVQELEKKLCQNRP